ncbi:MAG: 3'(2'),5'-bisphosphate nucleotidase CysQ [Acidaminobacteraceae bacterium]
MKLIKELKLAKEIAIIAGEKILEIYKQDFDVEYKADETPLTEADLSANAIIVDAIKLNYPDHAILSEEMVDDFDRLENDWCWIIDPVDGTKEFVKKNDEFTVNIALAFRGEVVLGVVYAPVYGELYYAVLASGAFIEIHGEKKEITVSSRHSELRALKSRSHISLKYAKVIEKHKSEISTLTKMGSSLKGCKIAAGEYDMYYNFGSKTSVWDTAAMEIIVLEAGGAFSDLYDNRIDYSEKEVKNINGFKILNDIANDILKE